MNKSSLITSTKKTFYHSLEIVNKNPLIYVLALLISFKNIFVSIFNLPQILSLLITVFLIGWLGARIDLLYQAYEKKTIKWNQLGHLFIKYLKKLFPIIIILSILLFFTLVILSLIYFNSILSESLSSLERKQLIANEIRNIQNSDTGLTTFSLQQIVLTFLSLLSGFIFTQAIVKMIVNKKNILVSLKETIIFFLRDVRFFILLALIATAINQILHTTLNFTQLISLESILFISIWAYINLIISTMILINYLD